MTGAEFDDIVAGVDQLVEEDIIDAEKVGVTPVFLWRVWDDAMVW